MHTVMNKVILIHGLLCNTRFLYPMANQLRKQNLDPVFFSYHSLREHSSTAQERLKNLIEQQQMPCHIVGHSLGGLLAVNTLQTHPYLQECVTSMICVGSPLRGSKVAQHLVQSRLGNTLIGRNRTLLKTGCSEWTGRTAIGSIAGSKCLGLGKLLTHLEIVNDGTVGLSETQLQGIEHHITLPASHTGLLWHQQTVDNIVHFIQKKSFKPVP